MPLTMKHRMMILGTKVNPAVAKQAKRRARKQGFDTVSAYVRSLIEADLKRDQKAAA